MQEESLNYLFIALGGIPLIIYPFVFVANIMSLAGERKKSGAKTKSCLFAFISGLFFFLSFLYPLTYITCLLFVLINRQVSLWVSVLPLIHLAAAIATACIWRFAEKITSGNK